MTTLPWITLFINTLFYTVRVLVLLAIFFLDSLGISLSFLFFFFLFLANLDRISFNEPITLLVDRNINTCLFIHLPDHLITFYRLVHFPLFLFFLGFLLSIVFIFNQLILSGPLFEYWFFLLCRG